MASGRTAVWREEEEGEMGAMASGRAAVGWWDWGEGRMDGDGKRSNRCGVGVGGGGHGWGCKGGGWQGRALQGRGERGRGGGGERRGEGRKPNG